MCMVIIVYIVVTVLHYEFYYPTVVIAYTLLCFILGYSLLYDLAINAHHFFKLLDISEIISEIARYLKFSFFQLCRNCENH